MKLMLILSKNFSSLYFCNLIVFNRSFDVNNGFEIKLHTTLVLFKKIENHLFVVI